MLMKPRVQLFGIPYDNLGMNEVIGRIDEFVRDRRPAMVVTPNVDHVLRMQRDHNYARLVRRADLILPDGQPLVWSSRLLGRPLKQRVAGSDLFIRLCEHAAEAGYRVFFLGGEPGAADRAGEVLNRRLPGFRLAGSYCPPYGFEGDPQEKTRMLEIVRQSRPDILFVGLGSPKQEHWIAENMGSCGVPVSIGVGVSFSFACGQIRRAPLWMQKAGLEWLHRLYREPRRLWKRYLLRGPTFFPLVAREFFFQRLLRRRSWDAYQAHFDQSNRQV
jgi:N-acetylglucosaminyldiphosphoundecaprenol N-acetyl-beta-D-mannosaminyltransferase